jgi:hypothetical protein
MNGTFGSEVRVRPIEKLPFDSITAERLVTNSLQTGTTHGWNGSNGRKADIHGGFDGRLLLADSRHAQSWYTFRVSR